MVGRDPLASLPFDDLLADVAAATPAPGGGSSAALTCALAASLAEMAAGFAPNAAAVPGPGARAAELRARALELADLDLDSYAPVLAALRRPADDEARGAAVADALSNAAAVPFAVVEVSAEACELASGVALAASRHVVGDAVTATLLARAACEAAATLVALNLEGISDDHPNQAAELVRRADVACRQALSKVHES
jgi:methenyltetrahydrofolate cyclohydrolase